MRKSLSWFVPTLALLLTWGGLTVFGQNSAGGAFQPGNDYTVSGAWTWRVTLTPWVIEGATEDAFETRITFAEPTADRTFTFPNATSGTFLFSSLATNGIDVANSIWGASNGLVFEGATADAFETTVASTNVGADVTATLPGGGNAAYAIMASALTTNDVDIVNSVWGVSNGLRFEGATADAFETTLAPTNVGAAITLTLPGLANASGAILGSTLTTNDVDVVNSIWGVSNGLRFEGATADAFETTVSPTNVGASITLTLPGLANASGAILATTLTTNDVNVANSVWGVSNGIAFGGATGADGFEITLSPADVGADRAITIPDMGAASALLATTLTTNAPNVANSVWGVSNGIAFGGATGADGFELTLSPADVGADRAVTIPDMGAASALLATTLTTNAPNVANSIWGVSNGLAFGGATGADGFELTLSPADVGADRAVTIPDMGADSALLASTLTTNTVGAANAVWGISNALVFEGATGAADANEVTLTLADPTADITIQIQNDLADTYAVLTQPTADVTGGFWQIPEFGAADADLTMTDNTLYVYRLYLPNWITIANIRLRATQGAQVAGVDDILGVSIYEDADAGAQRVTGSSADVAATGDITIDNADATLGPGFYRVAVCSGDGDGAAFVADTVNDEYIDVANLGTVRIGTGANACVAGVPPATTGALTTADINVPVLKFGP